MTVKLIYVEDHGLIGVASNWESALDLAIESNFITDSTEIYIADENGYAMSTVEEFFGEHWKEAIKNLDATLFDTLFEGIIQINNEEVYTIE